MLTSFLDEVVRRSDDKANLAQLGVDSPLTSCHVLEGSSVASTLVRYAESNHVNTIVLGIGNPGNQVQRWVNSIAVRVAMLAPCTVTLVKLEETAVNG
ncbi:MAG: universal stress protein [Betaproteobacteria bacterium]|nr:universal stress protein [Betaproteobacteria bacterium]